MMAVVGNGQLAHDDPRYLAARALGKLAVDHGFRVLCGGMGGVMEAACRGAHESGSYREGDTVGLLPGNLAASANPWVDIAIPTGLGHLRNGLVASAAAVVAVGGGAGTLSEVAFAWMQRRPIVALVADGWSGELAGRSLDDKPRLHGPIARAADPQEAIALVVSLLARQPAGG